MTALRQHLNFYRCAIPLLWRQTKCLMLCTLIMLPFQECRSGIPELWRIYRRTRIRLFNRK